MARHWRDPARLERKVFFYRINVVGDPDGLAPYDVAPVIAELRSLLRTDDRYLVRQERATFVVPETGSPPRLRLFNVRRADLPQIESAGVLSPLLLDEQAGVADQIHLVFFPDNVLGSEFNFFGPRAPRLADFLRSKSIGPRIEIVPLFRDDAVTRLDEMQEIRMGRLRLQRGAGSLLRRVDATLASAFDELEETSGGANVEITLRRVPRSRESLPQRLRNLFGELASTDGAGEVITAIQLEGRDPETGEFETVDLLEQQLVSTRRILRSDPRSRVLDSNDAYRQIEAAHQDLLAEIRRAGTITDLGA